MLPDYPERFYIFREAPLVTGNAYSLFSDDRTYSLNVKIEPLIGGSSWSLSFGESTAQVTAALRINSTDFEFMRAGEHYGRVREARWSVSGKSKVEDESGKILGFVVSEFSGTSIRSADDAEIAAIRRWQDPSIARVLGPSDAHLVERYVWKRVSAQPCDRRLLYCFVCLLLIAEKSR